MSEEKPKRIAIISIHGSMDMAYPPLILASAAAAMDMEAAIYFSFYGLEILKKNKNLQVAPLANPAAPHPIPGIPIGVPNIIGVLPGMTAMATMMMKSWMKNSNVMSVDQLIQACIKSGVRMIACQMMMSVMNVKKEELIDGVEIGGAAMFLDYAVDANITLSF
jgi:peroxiredoxin family protein